MAPAESLFSASYVCRMESDWLHPSSVPLSSASEIRGRAGWEGRAGPWAQTYTTTNTTRATATETIQPWARHHHTSDWSGEEACKASKARGNC